MPRDAVRSCCAAYEIAVNRGVRSSSRQHIAESQCVPWKPCRHGVDTGVVSRPAPPMLTIWHNGSESTFVPGHDVIVGRDLRADVRIADPRISRAHLILRFEQGKWVAIDNGSVNGTFVNGYRRPVIDIHDGQSINIGNAGGPQLTFEIGPRRSKGGPPPASGPPRTAQQTMTWSTPARPAPPVRQPPAASPRRRPAPPGPAGPRRRHRRSIRPPCRPAGRPAGPPPDQVTVINARAGARRDTTCRPPKSPCSMPGRAEGDNFATRFVKRIAPRAIAARRQARRLGHDRPGVGQRHRDPRRAGLPLPRNIDPDAVGHRDPRHQRQRHVRQRHPGRLGDPQRRRRRHRRQHRPGGRAAACWSAAAKPRPPPAPAAWRCATSSTSSRTANNCSATSR